MTLWESGVKVVREGSQLCALCNEFKENSSLEDGRVGESLNLLLSDRLR